MQFSGKFGVFTPPWRVHAPPRENPGSATGYTLKKMVTCTVMEHVHSKLHWCVAFKTKTQNRELNSKQQTAVASFYQQRKRGLNEENES